MVFEFIGKVKGINEDKYLEESISSCLADVGAKVAKPFTEVRVLKDGQAGNVLVKGKTSVSSYASYHDVDLNDAIDTFKVYVEAIEKTLGGEISKDEGFYNNSKTFHKMIW